MREPTRWACVAVCLCAAVGARGGGRPAPPPERGESLRIDRQPLPPDEGGLSAGETLVLSVMAVADDEIAYQWRRGGAPLDDGPRTAGSKSPELILACIREAESGEYDVVVTAGETSMTSDAAAVLVLPDTACPGDTDGNGTVDFDDLNLVLGGFGVESEQCLESDDNTDGVIDMDDLNRVLGSFGASCE